MLPCNINVRLSLVNDNSEFEFWAAFYNVSQIMGKSHSLRSLENHHWLHLTAIGYPQQEFEVLKHILWVFKDLQF